MLQSVKQKVKIFNMWHDVSGKYSYPTLSVAIDAWVNDSLVSTIVPKLSKDEKLIVKHTKQSIDKLADAIYKTLNEVTA